MRNDLPNVEYERGMNHNYMVLGKCDFFGAAKESGRNYRVRMLLENSIPGLLPITQRQANGESKYYYEINSLQPLSRLMEKSALKYRELKALFLGCINVFDRLEEYLLDGGQIIIKPDYIYINVENMEPYFVCYPDYKGDVRLSFVEFVDELLTHIDHTDEQAVMLGYQVYRYTRNPNYVISEIKRFTECSPAEPVRTEDIKSAHRPNEETGGFCFAPENAVFAAEGGRYDGSNYDDNNYDDNGYDEYGSADKNNGIIYIIGGFLGLCAAVCAGGAIAFARIFNSFKISKLIAENELYICGAAVAALSAAALSCVYYIKTVKKRQNIELEALNAEEEDEMYREVVENDIVNNLTNKAQASGAAYGKSIAVSSNAFGKKENICMAASNETVCLGGGVLEERLLRGRVNGKEVNVALERLPLTIGKLEGMSDFVINDTAVSKMHARFEEHGGRVCVCDLNSTNGTVRNGETIRINTPVPLEPGDTLRFGRSCFTYL